MLSTDKLQSIGASATITHGSLSPIFTMTTDRYARTVLVLNGQTSTVPDDAILATSTAPS